MDKAVKRQITLLTGQSIETPDTEPAKHPGGRPRKNQHKQDAQAILDKAAPVAAQILSDHVSRKRSARTIKSSLQRACEYVIDHAIGKPRQKVEHSGGILTYQSLAKSADDLEQNGREDLADKLEISKKFSKN